MATKSPSPSSSQSPKAPKSPKWRWGKLASQETDTGYGRLSSISPSVRSTPQLDALSPQHRLFCLAYVHNGFNGTDASLKAQYSPNTAAKTASVLLTRPEIAAAIDSLLRIVANRYAKRADDVIAELEFLTYANMLDYVVIDDVGCPRIDLSHVTRSQGAAIKKIVSEVIERKEDAIDAKTGQMVMGYTVRKTTLELHDKPRSIELLGKYHRLWQEGDGRQKDRLDELITALAGPVSDGRKPTPTPAQLQLTNMAVPGTQGQPQ